MMKRFVSVLLVAAFLFGLGSAVSSYIPEPVVADGPVYPPPIVPPWPDENSNGMGPIVADGPVYPPPIVPPWPDQNSIGPIVADGPVYPPPIVPPWPNANSIGYTS
jgi:hypothetical protein